jgi:hypothetical protein
MSQKNLPSRTACGGVKLAKLTLAICNRTGTLEGSVRLTKRSEFNARQDSTFEGQKHREVRTQKEQKSKQRRLLRMAPHHRPSSMRKMPS